MTEPHIPTERELDALLHEQPRFDLEAVKRRTLSRIGATAERPVKRRIPLRGFLVAAVICALSISAVAAADYATDGQITRALGIRKPQMEAVSEPSPAPEKAPPPVLEPEPPVPPMEPQPVQEPPELDEQIAGALQIDSSQAQRLRPAVQKIEQTAEDQGVRMTVLQTLGDPTCLYIKLRFDFPEAVPYKEFLEFDDLYISLGDANSYGWQETILEQDERSVTYLLSARLYGEKSLNGQTITVTAQNYGHPHQYTADEVVQLAGEAGKPYTSILYPDGTLDWEVAEEDLAALPPEAAPLITYSQGFTISRREDGSKVVSYDGEHGDQMMEVYLVPDFDAVVAGKWEQSWTLSYQDLSLYWNGETELFDPRLTLTELRLSPLSWSADFTATENVPEGETLNFDLIPKDWDVQLRRRDGSLTSQTLHCNGGSGSSPVPNEVGFLVTDITAGTVFDQPIDLSDVTAVIIEGKQFPVS